MVVLETSTGASVVVLMASLDFVKRPRPGDDVEEPPRATRNGTELVEILGELELAVSDDEAENDAAEGEDAKAKRAVAAT
jgi:hypothetical protein